ncbi:hypothetical protein [Bacillus kexueae]|uniref:hypothetical protein n=1 Tax=Aeribacillus kexueae TaxID=2078952 RepID=UPI001FAFD484|nr:hypothetical protein [Bacillus kexueae]
MMVAKKVEKQSVSPIDVVWDGWYSNVKVLNSIQQDFETRSLEAVKRQREMLEVVKEQMEKMEQEAEGITKEWKDNLLKQMDQMMPIPSDQFQLWIDKLEEVGVKMQSMSMTPYKQMMETVLQAQTQVESTYTEIVSQQKKHRDEFLRALEEVTEQQKKAQEAFFNTFQSYQSIFTKMVQA